MESLRKHLTDPSSAVRRHAPYLLIILLLALAVYGRTLSFDFLTNWDDPDYITQNKAIRGFSLQHLALAFTHPYVGNIAPVQIISYMLDHLLWGMNPFGFHLTAILLHAANGMLLYALVTRISGEKIAGLIAALIFTAHPVQVETVAWLSQRKNLLSLFFFLIAFLSYIRSQCHDRQSRRLYLISLVAFAASLLAKSTSVVLPLCLAAYEVLVAGNRLDKRVWRRMIPFAVAAGAMALLTIAVQTPEMGGGRVPYHGGSPWATFLTMIPVMVRYLKMLVLPTGLSALYIVPIRTFPDMQVLMSLALLGGACIACATCYRRLPSLFFWCALFFIPFIPVLQIIPLVTLINDRYLYFPMLGAAGLLGHGIVLLTARLPSHRQSIYAVTACCMLALSVAAFERTAYWRNSVILWSDTALKNPPSKDIMGLLAASYNKAGQTADAIGLYRQIFSQAEDFAEPRNEQGALLDAAMIYMSIGSFTEAENLLQRLTAKFPQNPAGFSAIALCYSATGRRDDAEAAYNRALALAPDNPQALVGQATLYLDANAPHKAAPLLARVAEAGVEGPDLRVAQARFAAAGGNYDRALDHLEQALREGLVNADRLSLVPEFAPLKNSPRLRRITGGSP